MHAHRIAAVVRRVLVAAVLVSLFSLGSYPAQAREKVIYNMTSSADYPESVLVADSNGVLYGTASTGGSTNNGAIFSLTPPGKRQSKWTETILYNFQGGSDGSFPTAGLTPDGSGGYYGTTAAGGDGPCEAVGGGSAGCGTVYHLTPGEGQAWTETVIYAFQGGNDGERPMDRLLLDSATGVLYGTTYGSLAGGQGYRAGTVFSLTPAGQNWTLTVLYAFTGGADGGFPFGNLIADSTGDLYGTTSAGGDGGDGTVFELTPGQNNWTETVLYSFLGWYFSDGSNPSAGLIFDASGNLYGGTDGGGYLNYGTVFELSPSGGGSWTETVIYSFDGEKHGAFVDDDVIMDAKGDIYGVTAAGGKSNDGTLFKLTPPDEGQNAWKEKNLVVFDGTDGSYSGSGLLPLKVGQKTVLYGDTFTGGSSNDGVVYEITASGFSFP
jgi:uncharacterized repeat protein (TIGR03803 family)